MAYQTFKNQKGDSDSSGKLNALNLPDLKGKKFLDIGCNEGFFCIEAKKRGATRIVGIDKNPNFIELAKKRDPDIDFRVQDWDNLPNEKFDIVLLLSAMHYVKDKQKLFDDIYKIISEDGTLILECGVAAGSGNYIETKRAIDSVLHPTRNFLINTLLKKYSVRDWGNSVKQTGDPVNRKIFHCKKYKPMVMVISGRSGDGKTMLAREFGINNIPTISSDDVICKLSIANNEDRLHRFLRENLNFERIDLCYEALVKNGLYSDFVEEIIKILPIDKRLIALEGYAFYLEEFQKQASKRLNEQGYFVWLSKRLKPQN